MCKAELHTNCTGNIQPGGKPADFPRSALSPRALQSRNSWPCKLSTRAGRNTRTSVFLLGNTPRNILCHFVNRGVRQANTGHVCVCARLRGLQEAQQRGFSIW